MWVVLPILSPQQYLHLESKSGGQKRVGISWLKAGLARDWAQIIVAGYTTILRASVF